MEVYRSCHVFQTQYSRGIQNSKAVLVFFERWISGATVPVRL